MGRTKNDHPVSAILSGKRSRVSKYEVCDLIDNMRIGGNVVKAKRRRDKNQQRRRSTRKPEARCPTPKRSPTPSPPSTELEHIPTPSFSIDDWSSSNDWETTSPPSSSLSSHESWLSFEGNPPTPRFAWDTEDCCEVISSGFAPCHAIVEFDLAPFQPESKELYLPWTPEPDTFDYLQFLAAEEETAPPEEEEEEEYRVVWCDDEM